MHPSPDRTRGRARVQPDPPIAGSPLPRSAQIGLGAEVEELVGPFDRSFVPKWRIAEPGCSHRPIGQVEHRGELGEAGDQRWTVERGDFGVPL